MDARDSSTKANRSARFFQICLTLAALLPFALAVCFVARGPIAQGAAKGEERTSLIFTQYLVNLGDVPPGKRYAHAYFRFFNAGSTPVTLKNLRASCDCINPQVREQKMVYAPGEWGDLYATIEAPKESAGEHEFIITVSYEDDQPRQTELNFRATLPVPQVAVHPKALLFYQLDGQESIQTVAVIDNRAKPLKVLGVEYTSSQGIPLGSAKLGEVKNEGGVNSAEISVTVPAKVPEQRIMETVTVRTDDPEYATLKIPVMIEGRKIGFSGPSGPAAAAGAKTDRQ